MNIKYASYMVAPGLKFMAKFNKSEMIVEDIIRACSGYFGVDPFSKSRRVEIVECRKFCYLFIRQNTSLSLKHIAALFDQDHTTAIHNLKSIEGLLETEPITRDHYNCIQSRLR